MFTFAIHVAGSPKEYMDSLYIITATVAISVSYATITFKTTKLFAIFDVFEKSIDERKTRDTLSILNEKLIRRMNLL